MGDKNMPKLKDINSESTKNRRRFLELLEPANKKGMTRSEIRMEYGIKPEEGKTHDIFNDMEKNDLIVQEKEADGQFRIYITTEGIGYLKSMKDFGIGL
jgi:hypothetical protein